MTNEELTVMAKQGDKNAELQLWEQVQRLIRKKAMRRLPDDGHTSRIELDDLMQAGYIAMMNAIKDFNPASGFLFNTYLTYHLKNAFAIEQGIKTTRRDALLAALSMDATMGSYDDEDELTIVGTLEAPGAEIAFEDMIERVATQQAFNTVIEHVEKLEPQQANVIKKYYLNGQTLRQIAEHEGVTVEVIRQRESKALRKLRNNPAIRKIGRELYADEHTNFFLHIGVNAFQSGAGSAPELLSERRDLLIERMRQDLAADIQKYSDTYGRHLKV